jgi:apolipoprotein N-acyltransferase
LSERAPGPAGLWYDARIAYMFAAASGVLLVLSFPQFGHPALAWAALAPLLVALSGSSSSMPRQPGPTLSRAFLLGLTTGVIYFAGTLYWITGVMATYGGLHTWVAVLLNAALIAYLALYPAIFAVVVRRAILSLGQIALMSAPFVWVATELGRTHVLTGFPWVLLGYSQATVLPIAQAASLFGVYGVSALVVSVAAAGALVAVSGRSRRGLVSVALIAILVLGTSIWGAARVAADSMNRLGEPITVGLIQGNVDQGLKWDPTRARDIFQDYLRMTRQAIADGAQLVVWPESSTPFYFEEDRAAADEVRSIARQFQVSILLGSDEIERGRRPGTTTLRSWSVRTVRRVPRIERFTSCRSASTCRSSRSCSSPRRSSRPSRTSRPAPIPRSCRSTAISSARRSATRSSTRISCAGSSLAAASC